ncbi:MAG: hypothetical protein JJT85_10595 [Chromatiales bacterium]|nr:hypothetical protein [Chromatiales bacterium]
MNLRDEVERRLPNWRSWYPSLFDAAVDLGLLRARPCDPSTLLIANRHAGIRHKAEQAHREKWGGNEDTEEERLLAVQRQLRAARNTRRKRKVT